MKLKKDDIIRDGPSTLSVFCVLGRVIYAKRILDVNESPSYEWEEVLKHYRKIEIIGS